jgi:cytochrome c-type biogenesis protein CcmE
MAWRIALDRRRLKFLLLGSGVLLSMSFLVVVGMNDSRGFVYYVTVGELLADPGAGREGTRINGKVVQGSIERQPTGQDVRFVMTDGTHALSVSYHGIVPDTFVDRADVVVEGRLQQDGSFQAHTLLAKCPSKYEAAEGQASH